MTIRIASISFSDPVVFDLIRHGETEANVAGRISGQRESPLTSRGVEQALQLRSQLRASYDGVWCSPQQRAVDTLQLAYTGSFFRDDRLRERHAGILEGTPIDPNYRHTLDEKPEEGESNRDVAWRVFRFLKEIATSDVLPGHVLICAHSGSLRMMHAVLYNTPEATMFSVKWANAQLIRVSISVLRPPTFLCQ